MQGIYTFFTRRKISLYLFFLFLTLFLYLPSAFFRKPFPPDEMRNINIVNNIQNVKTAFVLSYQNRNYYDKPPLYFWIVKLLYKINIFPSYLVLPILFNAIASWLILCLNFYLFKQENKEEIGFLSSLILATMASFYGLNIILRMDILFLLFIFLSVFFFIQGIKYNNNYFLLGTSAFTFLAVFTKGAFGFTFPLFIELGYAFIEKRRNILKKMLIVNIVAIGLIIMWLGGVSLLDSNYFKEMVFSQTFNRILGKNGHLHSLFFYFPYTFLLTLPWSFGFLGYIIHIIRTPPQEKIEKLFIIWVGGGFLFLSLVASKLPIYILLLSIPISGLTAQFLLENKEKGREATILITELFFIIIWIAGFIYFKTKADYIPREALFSLFIFVSVFILSLVKPLRNLKYFLISWIIFLQLINLVYFPLANKYYESKSAEVPHL